MQNGEIGRRKAESGKQQEEEAEAEAEAEAEVEAEGGNSTILANQQTSRPLSWNEYMV